MKAMHIPEAARTLERDLRSIFGERLRSLVVYAPAAAGADRTPTLAVVDRLSAEDLRACAGLVAAWDDAGLDTPLLLGSEEFSRSLDAFPFEFGAILADHTVVAGADPFVGLRVDQAHLRQACELQARSHLLHLREGYLETRGRGDALADLVRRSAAPLAALLRNVARLEGLNAADAEAAAQGVERKLDLADGTLAGVVRLTPDGPLSSDRARRLFPGYLEATERLVAHVDRWSAA
jgi:hypothetical protein